MLALVQKLSGISDKLLQFSWSSANRGKMAVIAELSCRKQDESGKERHFEPCFVLVAGTR